MAFDSVMGNVFCICYIDTMIGIREYDAVYIPWLMESGWEKRICLNVLCMMLSLRKRNILYQIMLKSYHFLC